MLKIWKKNSNIEDRQRVGVTCLVLSYMGGNTKREEQKNSRRKNEKKKDRMFSGYYCVIYAWVSKVWQSFTITILKAWHKNTTLKTLQWSMLMARTTIVSLCFSFGAPRPPEVFFCEKQAALFYLLIHLMCLSLYLKGDLTGELKRLVSFYKGNIWWNSSNKDVYFGNI